MTLRQFFQQLREVRYRADGAPVLQTVAEAVVHELSTEIRAVPGTQPLKQAKNTLVLSVNQEDAADCSPCCLFRIEESGGAFLGSSFPSGLFALWRLVAEEWMEKDVEEFGKGVTLRPGISWLRNLNDHLVGSLRCGRGFDREEYFCQLARGGFTHVSINGLGVNRPFETGPPGDVYWWFYDYSPDLDQFFDSTLLRGYYPADYLNANRQFLRENAALALKYGLTPGLHINSPRSMPEAFWERYSFLRGARIDHPRESFRPRYTLAMAHPVVQSHYRELITSAMREIPEIGFIHVWTNDSGAGFEFVSSLYAGRNGGPYLIREWKDDEEIARAAARNVMTYYRLLRDEARRVNPQFRLICDLGPFHAERKFIIPELDDGIDAGAFGYFEKSVTPEEAVALRDAGVQVHRKLDLTEANIIGAPYPRLVYEQLSSAVSGNTIGVLTNATPASLAPFDINGEVIRAVQLHRDVAIETILTETATRWVGSEHADRLVSVWNRADEAVRNFPAGIPYSTFAFPWFRLWVRPFVPDIGAIPEAERAYYERFLLATFNNPTRVDLNNDMMWNFLTVDEAAAKVTQVDRDVLPPLEAAIGLCSRAAMEVSSDKARIAFIDQAYRLTALRCFCTTLRNTAAWIESVHGYLQSGDVDTKGVYREKLHASMALEISNTESMLKLWRESSIEFIPVSREGETLHIYGENFDTLLEEKIRLMRLHADDEPYIDPDFMWHLPEESEATR
jgi:hypothetical protein